MIMMMVSFTTITTTTTTTTTILIDITTDGLVHLARIRKGEVVLIHCASGGVGHAAISICQHYGAIILATASRAKHSLLHGMGVEHVFDSRSTSWYKEVMRVTNGKGVDIILNSLAGDHQRLGIQALGPRGRFLEIGKVDIFNNSKMDLMPFRKNTSFFAIDMDRMALEDPDYIMEIGGEVVEHIVKGHYRRLPITTAPMSQLKEMLEVVKSGKHVGKVVMVNYHDHDGGGGGGDSNTTTRIPFPVTAYHTTNSKRQREGTILITGGTGGFGGVVIQTLFQQGHRHFLLPTRQGDSEEVRKKYQYIMDTPGATVEFIKADVSCEEDVMLVVGRARAAIPPLRKIINAAGISVEAVLDQVTIEDYRRVAYSKARTAWLLHELTQDMELDDFITVSSVATLINGIGVSCYAAANAFLDGLVRYRRSMGLPATTFNLG